MALPQVKHPDIALLFRLRQYFIPFLLPAAALVILALFQANLTLAATSAGQRLLDHFLHIAPTQVESKFGVFSGAMSYAAPWEWLAGWWRPL